MKIILKNTYTVFHRAISIGQREVASPFIKQATMLGVVSILVVKKRVHSNERSEKKST